MVLDKVLEDEELVGVLKTGVLWTLRGAFLLGAILFLEKIVGFTIDFSIGLGL